MWDNNFRFIKHYIPMWLFGKWKISLHFHLFKNHFMVSHSHCVPSNWAKYNKRVWGDFRLEIMREALVEDFWWHFFKEKIRQISYNQFFCKITVIKKNRKIHDILIKKILLLKKFVIIRKLSSMPWIIIYVKIIKA